MLTALTRGVGPNIASCALTYRQREPIDADLARRQHADYENLLRELGVRVLVLPPDPELPDAVFVEDTAVVVDEIAVITSPLLSLRRRETTSVARALEPHRTLSHIEPDGHLEGGDVLHIDRTLYVGLSTRSDQAGIRGLAQALAPYGYAVHSASFKDCLHLKTACTAVAPDTVLANPAFVDTSQFPGVDTVTVDPEEPDAGNALLVGETVIMPASSARTAEKLARRGISVRLVDVSELEKAEAGVTCCSILFETL